MSAIMAGNLYLCDHMRAFAWTCDSTRARLFKSPIAAEMFIAEHVSGDLRIVTL